MRLIRRGTACALSLQASLARGVHSLRLSGCTGTSSPVLDDPAPRMGSTFRFRRFVSESVEASSQNTAWRPDRDDPAGHRVCSRYAARPLDAPPVDLVGGRSAVRLHRRASVLSTSRRPGRTVMDPSLSAARPAAMPSGDHDQCDALAPIPCSARCPFPDAEVSAPPSPPWSGPSRRTPGRNDSMRDRPTVPPPRMRRLPTRLRRSMQPRSWMRRQPTRVRFSTQKLGCARGGRSVCAW